MNKEAYKSFFKKLPYTLQFSGIISLCLLGLYGILYLINALVRMSIASLISSFFGIFNFLITIFLISILFNLITPFIYSYFASNSILDTPKRDDVTVKNFLRTYLIGRTPLIKKTLNIYNVILNAFIFYILSAVLISSITYTSLINSNVNGLGDLYQEFLKVLQIQNQEDMINELNLLLSQENVEIMLEPFIYINFVSIFISLYYFIHTINLFVFKYYLNNTIYGAHPKIIHTVFKRGLKERKGEFYKEYYGTLFPLTIFFVILIAGCYFGLTFIPSLRINVYVLNITTIFVVLICLLPFMPISFNLYGDMYPRYATTFVNYFVTRAKAELESMKSNYAQFNEAQKETIKRNEEQFKKFEEFVNNQKENSEENKSEDSNNNDDKKKE